jgi:hypothetical protein
MSELVEKGNIAAHWRRHLLTTVSVLTICGATCAENAAFADDADRPTVWMELGGQLERVENRQDAFLPPFLQTTPRPGFEATSPASTQKPPRYAIGGEAKLTFAPEGSDWSFMAAVRYGRSNSSKHLHEQSGEPRDSGVSLQGLQPYHISKWVTAFGDTATKHKEGHAVLDFMAGKDVGLGLLGRSSSTTVGFGFRFAQFTSSSSTTLMELPDPFWKRTLHPNPFLPQFHIYTVEKHHHSYYATENSARSFSGIGPALSIAGSSPFLGSMETGEVSLDWGANAALLFGRQKAGGNTGTSGVYFNQTYHYGTKAKSSYDRASPFTRHHNVIVPNVGGFAGLTFRRENAKVSFGYRADFFFGAMDGGIDTRRTSTVGFYGPFATISIGLGG